VRIARPYEMPEYCTCGTQLVEGARFCHKCGRPTSGEPEIAVEVPRSILTPSVLTPPVLPPMGDMQVSFANPVVLRIAFAAAALSILMDSMLSVLFIIWAMGAGFMAVWMYRRRTGLPVSVSSGAKLGWITGVFSFVISTVMVTAAVLLSGDKLAQELRHQVTTTWSKDPNYQQILSTFENPATFATAIVFAMFFFFVLLSVASVAGGALGARFSNKQ
jgi:uncharacterized membrane protein (DUF485 family)